MSFFAFWSKDFRRIAEIQTRIPSGTPLMACTATVTHSSQEEIVSTLEMSEVVKVETDFSESLSTLKEKLIDTPRGIAYYRNLMICADPFSHFSYEMGKSQYYPPGAPELIENVSSACFMLVLLNTAKI